jgi:hypothetical protein
MLARAGYPMLRFTHRQLAHESGVVAETLAIGLTSRRSA